MNVKPSKTYTSGEPKDSSVMWLGIGLMVLIVGWMIWFIGDGYGGALFGLILMLIRLGFFLAILVGLVMMAMSLRSRYRHLAVPGLLTFLAGMIGFFGLFFLASVF